ncbi:unnamed protein product [Pylaiella littoralis]
MKTNLGDIGNKAKRTELYRKQKGDKKAEQKDRRRRREREAQELGEEAPPKQVPKTLESTRDPDRTVVKPADEEVFRDEAEDEFAKFFSNEQTPKIMITTRPRPSGNLFHFVQDLLRMVPNAFFYPRKSYTVKQICQWANNKKFTHLFVISERLKKCNGLIASVLPHGPTAFFKVSNVVPSAEVFNHGKVTAHQPEIILNNFNTRLGHRVGRFLGSFFPHEPEFNGRQVVTFHNQRDYIFVRYHRYIFAEGKGDGKEKKTRARLQELGPRFTLKMRWLQEGTFDTQFGEYEWIHKRKEMDSTRRTFHL